MASSPLTKHGIAVIFGDHKTHPAYQQPIVQILNTKKISAQASSANGAAASVPEKYRLILSDGEQYCQGVLATQMNHLMHAEEIVKNSIVKLNKFVFNNVAADRKVAIILDVSVIQTHAEKIGDPASVETTPSPLTAQGETTPSAATVSAPPTTAPTNALTAAAQQATNPLQAVANQFQQHQSAYNAAPSSSVNPYGASASSAGAEGHVWTIQSLNPYSNRWQIKARVSAKSDIKHYTNARGDGKLFNVTFTDESGEIKATAFNDSVDMFEPLLERGKVYYVSKMAIKPARKQFNAIAHEYELYFEHGTEIALATDDTQHIPEVKYSFVSVADISATEVQAHVDVIGIIKELGDVGQIVTKSTQRQLSKRDITLVDTTAMTIKLTIWGREAETFTGQQGAVLAAKGIKVGDYGGRSLSTIGSSVIMVDPDIPETQQLKQWYATSGTDQQFASISTASVTSVNEVRKTIQQTKDENVGLNPKGDYYSVLGYINFIKSDGQPWYQACPTPGCNRKVTDEAANSYRCEKCNTSFDRCDYRYVLNMSIMDATNSQWVTAFNEHALAILGKSAYELHTFRDNSNEEAYAQVFHEAIYKQYVFRVKAKTETYQDEQKLRCSLVSCTPINYQAESQRLLQLINSY